MPHQNAYDTAVSEPGSGCQQDKKAVVSSSRGNPPSLDPKQWAAVLQKNREAFSSQAGCAAMEECMWGFLPFGAESIKPLS